MPFTTDTLARAAFKILQGRAHTSASKDLANEVESSVPVLASNEVYANKLTDGVSQAISDGYAVFAQVNLEEDPSSGGKAYLAKINSVSGSALDGVLNPRTGLNFADGDRVANWIPPKYASDFRAIIYDNGTEVPPLSSEDWFFDYASGVVVSEDNLSLGSTGTIDGYVYTGQYLSDILENIAADGTLGSGLDGYVAYWSGEDTLTYDLAFTYDQATDTMGSGIVDVTNRYRINSTDALRMQGSNEVMVGNTGANPTGGENVLVGWFAGRTVDAGQRHVFIGALAGGNVSGSTRGTGIGYTAAQFAEGSSYVAIGEQAGRYQRGSIQSVNIGGSAGHFNEGDYGVAIGYSALYGRDGYSTSNYNIGIGYLAGRNIEAGPNIAIGREALAGVSGSSTGINNTAIGHLAGSLLTTGSDNVFLGYNTGNAISSESNCTFIGSEAGIGSSGANSIIAIGHRAGENTSSSLGSTYIGDRAGRNSTGNYNTVIGSLAMYNGSGSAFNNTVIGCNAAYVLSTGAYNTIIGMDAGRSITGANFNTMVGRFSGYFTTGSSNTYIGAQAGANSDAASNQVSIGDTAGRYLEGSNNVSIGAFAGAGVDGLSSGTDNVFIGRSAGNAITTGSSNIFIGYQAGSTLTTESNRLYIENSSTATGPLIYGEFDNDRVGINHASPGMVLDVADNDTSTTFSDSNVATIRVTNNGPAALNRYSSIQFYHGGIVTGQVSGIYEGSGSGGSGSLAFGVRRFGNFTERMRLYYDNGGLVIGDTSTTSKLQVSGEVQANTDPIYSLFKVAGNIREGGGGGNHPILASAEFTIPTVTTGAATVEHGANVYIEGETTFVTTVDNYALWVDDGTSRFDGDLLLEEIAAPATPTDGYGSLYAKTDGLVYWKNDSGSEFNLTSGGSSFSDQYLYMNDNYTTASSITGGLVVNYEPTGLSTTVNGSYTAGVAATSNPTVVTTGSGTFAAGDIVIFTGSVSNDGFYEVLSHSGTTLTIRGVGTTATIEDFSSDQFTAGSSDGATIAKVSVAIIRSGTDGLFETARGSSTTGSGLTYKDIYPNQVETLAYAATVDLDLNPAEYTYKSVTLTGNITFTTSNRSAGRVLVLRIVGDTVDRTLTWPAGWSWLGGPAPSALPANAVGLLSITAYGAADSDVIAGFSFETSETPVGGSGTATELAYFTDPDSIASMSGITWDGSSRLNIGIDGTAALPALTFGVADDPDTGIFKAGSNLLGFSAAGAEMMRLTDAGMVFNESAGGNGNVRMEGVGQTHQFYLDATNAYIGIRESSPTSPFHVTGDSRFDGYVLLDEIAAPATPASGLGALYAKTDGYLYWQNDSGQEFNLQLSGGGGGDVTKVGTPVDNQVAVWTGDGTIEGDANFTWDGTALSTNGAAVFNESGADVDFRIEGSSDENLLFVDASTDRTGIGINAPLGKFHVSGTDPVYMDRYANVSHLLIRRANGTQSSPTTLGTGSYFGYITFAGYDGSAFGEGPRIEARTTQGWTGAAHGSSLAFRVVQNSSTTQVSALELGPQEAVCNPNGIDYDFRVESLNQTHQLFVDAGNDRIGVRTGTPSHVVDIQAGTLSGSPIALNVEGTLSAAATQWPVTIDMAVSNSTGSKGALFTNLTRGSATAGRSFTHLAQNQTGASGATSLSSAGSDDAAFALYGLASAPDTTFDVGHSVGVKGIGRYSQSRNFGVIGVAEARTGQAAIGVGVYGTVVNQNASDTKVGGMFTLYGYTDTINVTDTAALIADNAAETAPIFIAKDNGSDVFVVENGGSLRVAEIAEPATPASGFGRLYEKTDGRLYFKNDAGTEYDLTDTGTGGNVTKVGTPVDNQVGVWTGDGTIEGDANFTWNGTALSVNGAAVFNEAGADRDFRVEGVGESNAFFVQGSDGFVGVGTNAPARQFDVLGAINTAAITASTSDTNTVREILKIKHLTSGNMVDGLGAGISFDVEDATSGNQRLAFIGVTRDGADNAGALDLVVYDVGVSRTRLFISAAETVVNDDGLDKDFRVESLNFTDAIQVDAGNDTVKLGTDTIFVGSNSREVQTATTTTTDATVTTIQTIATASNTTYMIKTEIVGKRTGGAAGSANDGAVYVRTARVKNNAGTVTIHNLQTDFTSEDQASFDGTISISGTNILVQVTGATNNNVSWVATTTIEAV